MKKLMLALATMVGLFGRPLLGAQDGAEPFPSLWQYSKNMAFKACSTLYDIGSIGVV